MKFASILSSLVAGGLVVGSAFADRGPPPPPPSAPKVPTKKGGIHVQIDGLDEMIDEQFEHALEMIGSNHHVPPAVRAKLAKRLATLKKKLRARVGNGSNFDPEELGELGEELGREMEAFGRDMEEWGKQFGKKDWGNFDVDIDIDDDDDDDDRDDDDDDLPGMPDEPDDIDDAIRDMGKLNLKPAQRDQIRRLRADSDAKVAAAKRELDRASAQLERQLANPSASDADIARAIDRVTQQEATIRKARILAWVNARRILDDGQRQKVEGAARGKTK